MSNMSAARARGRIAVRSTSLIIGLFTVLICAPMVSAQQAEQAQIDTMKVYEREIFEYPSFDRRDPFLALTAGTAIGPRFEDLALVGVLFSPEAGSVANLTDVKTGKRYRTRAGDRLGDIRVVAIREDQVDFVITSFGVSRQETLRVTREKEQDG